MPPHILLLGDACARAAGIKSVDELRADHGDEVDNPDALEALASTIVVPPFYYDVANLARSGYLPVLVTTSYDRLVERALSDLGLREASDFEVKDLDPRVAALLLGRPRRAGADRAHVRRPRRG